MLSKYSGRICTLDLASGPYIGNDVYKPLLRWLSQRSEPLLPRLKRIKLPHKPDNKSQRKLAMLFCSQSLEEIEPLWIHDHQIMHTLSRENCPLKVLSIDHYPTDPKEVANFDRLLGCSLKLSSFTLGWHHVPIPVDVWCVLACLPSLLKLDVCTLRSGQQFTHDLSKGFNRLQDLSVGLPNIFDATRLLNPSGIGAKQLSRLTLTIDGTDHLHLLPIIGKRFENLTELSLRNNAYFACLPDVQPNTFSCELVPTFPSLKFFWMSFDLVNTHRPFDDTDLIELSKKCPIVEALAFDTFSADGGITCNGLVGALDHCHKLRSLAVVLDASCIPTPEDLTARQIIPNKSFITLICYKESKLTSPTDFATFLQCIAPNSRKVFSCEDDAKKKGIWEEVRSIITQS